jgi:hypothetical protein
MQPAHVPGGRARALEIRKGLQCPAGALGLGPANADRPHECELRFGDGARYDAELLDQAFQRAPMVEPFIFRCDL